MSLKAAKQLYMKKNSLNRFIEQVQTLLADQSVGAERLEEAKGGLNAAWEVFDAAYDGLVKIQIEDETQAEDEEQGNLEVSVLNLKSNLTGIIEVQRLQDENFAEIGRDSSMYLSSTYILPASMAR